MNRFPLGKIGALAAILGMTLFTFVSCESPLGSGLGIKGHQLLRNNVSFDDTIAQFGNMQKSLKTLADTDTNEGEVGEGDGVSTTTKPKTEAKPGSGIASGGPLFKHDNRWLHWMYLGLFALAILSIFIPTGSRILVLLGALGVGGVIFWVDRFNAAILSDAGPEASMMLSFSWDTGAIATALGFAAIAICGFWGKPDRSA